MNLGRELEKCYKSRQSLAIGSRVLISLKQKQEHGKSKTLARKTRQNILFKEPLIHSMASSAYFHMMSEGDDQVIQLVGETNTGKSFNFDLLASYLSNLCRDANQKKSKVGSKIPKFSKILGAFGNTKGLLCNQRSEYIRYEEYQFSEKGKLMGVKIIPYMLNVQNVTSMNQFSSNFHIFYILVNGSDDDEKIEYKLKRLDEYELLKKRLERESENDSTDFKALKKALKNVGIGKRRQRKVFSILSCILLMGNLEFEHDGTVSNPQISSDICSILGIDKQLFELAIRTKSQLVRGQKIIKNLEKNDVCKRMHLLIRTIYQLLFSWIIEVLNENYALSELDFENYVGILDLPGRAVFDKLEDQPNDFSLHQCLINYAHEKWIHYKIQKLSDECKILGSLGVKLDQSILEFNNLSIMDLFCSKPDGIFTTLGNLTCEPNDNSSGLELKRKTNRSWNRSSHYIPLKSTTFAIVHYGDSLAIYDTLDWTVHNGEEISPDFVTLFRGDPEHPGTSNEFLQSLFSSRVIDTIEHSLDNRTVIETTPLSRSPSSRKTNSITGKQRVFKSDAKPIERTLVNQLDSSLNILYETLLEAKNWTIYHIKPSEKDGIWDHNSVNRQLKGLNLQTVSNDIMGCGKYASIISFDHFKERYSEVLLKQGLNPNEISPRILETLAERMDWCQHDYFIGNNSHVALSEISFRMLESQRSIPCSLEYVKGASLDENSSEYSDAESNLDTSVHNSTAMASAPPYPNPPVPKQHKNNISTKGTSITRNLWLIFTYILTWWIPSFFLASAGMKTKDRQLAWREKVALCIIILFMNALILFFLIGLGQVLCQKNNMLTPGEISERSEISNGLVYMYGFYYLIPKITASHLRASRPTSLEAYWSNSVLGRDVSSMFSKQPNITGYCSFPIPENFRLFQDALSGLQETRWHYHSSPGFDALLAYSSSLSRARKGFVVWDDKNIENFLLKQDSKMVILYDKVYDISAFGGYQEFQPNFMGPKVQDIFKSVSNLKNMDVSAKFNEIKVENSQLFNSVMRCMDNLFYVGQVDHRNDLRCQIGNYILLGSSIILMAVILFKFLFALQLGGYPSPEDLNKFVVCFVPCYTEDEKSLRKTIDSIADLDYADKRLLMFIVADGMVIGAGNDRPTPRIVLEVLGLDVPQEPEPLIFESLGDGPDQVNYGKVYHGLYLIGEKSIPFVIVVKVGKPSERIKPGNRGKRDSQMILMQFFSRVFYNEKMNPLELEIYRAMQFGIGITPKYYEYVLMVDADTELHPQSVKQLTANMIRDKRISGISGDIRLSNESESWVTVIQVYEYYISQHMSKAFESIFGSVTCLPGCFSMYRIYVDRRPVLIDKVLVAEYSNNNVDSLHLKNLLHLGEDRYLTTLLIKHFPEMRTKYTPAATCYTSVPHTWRVLVSQRRRWINSTVHNLLELSRINTLCGAGCFSLRFLVLIDLISTIIQPSTLFYIAYLIVNYFLDERSILPTLSIIILCSVYGLQIILFLLKFEGQNLGWIIAYILALPIWTFILPVYAFWHFDDFSWGDTRKVYEMEKTTTSLDTLIDAKSIDLIAWDDYVNQRQSVQQSNYIKRETGDN